MGRRLSRILSSCGDMILMEPIPYCVIGLTRHSLSSSAITHMAITDLPFLEGNNSYLSNLNKNNPASHISPIRPISQTEKHRPAILPASITAKMNLIFPSSFVHSTN
jgi:hypothetical protein